jgi:hypothetical protein
MVIVGGMEKRQLGIIATGVCKTLNQSQKQIFQVEETNLVDDYFELV